MSEQDSCVVRIVNLDETFTKETLKTLILMRCQPNGSIKVIFLKKDDKINIFYGYIVFEYSYDAVKVVESLNDYVHTTNKFEAELIGPNLKYRMFAKAGDDDSYSCSTCNGQHHDYNCPLRHLISERNNILRKRRVLVVGTGTGGIRLKLANSKEVSPDRKPKNDGANKAWRDGTSYSNIYISNIHFSITESDLTELVKPFGPIKKLYLVKDKETGRSKGFGYVHFKFRSDATEAISKLHGIDYKGRTLRVEWSKT